MKIINDRVARDIQSGVRINLNLGAGGSSRAGFYNLDKLPLKDVDILADLDEPLDQLPDNCVSEIHSRHALEHVGNFLGLMSEIHRITAPDGSIRIIVPHFSNPYACSDPTHVRFFGLFTMNYFVGRDEQPKRKVHSFYSGVRFHVDSIRIEFYRQGAIDRVFAPIVRRIVNRSFFWQEFYERRLCRLFHAWEIVFDMRPVK